MSKHSRFLSLILRHKPEEAGLTLDANGWVETSKVVQALRSRYGEFSHATLEEIVRDNDKKRFVIEGNKIRANRGHSVNIDLKLESTVPPEFLYHGTKQKFFGSILCEGLKPGSRQHVHLSEEIETAKIVAGRRSGEDIFLKIRTREMTQPFYQSANGVWLTDHVAPEFFEIILPD